MADSRSNAQQVVLQRAVVIVEQLRKAVKAVENIQSQGQLQGDSVTAATKAISPFYTYIDKWKQALKAVPGLQAHVDGAEQLLRRAEACLGAAPPAKRSSKGPPVAQSAGSGPPATTASNQMPQRQSTRVAQFEPTPACPEFRKPGSHMAYSLMFDKVELDGVAHSFHCSHTNKQHGHVRCPGIVAKPPAESLGATVSISAQGLSRCYPHQHMHTLVHTPPPTTELTACMLAVSALCTWALCGKTPLAATRMSSWRCTTLPQQTQCS